MMGVLAALLVALWYLPTRFYPEEEKELRTQIREAIRERFL